MTSLALSILLTQCLHLSDRAYYFMDQWQMGSASSQQLFNDAQGDHGELRLVIDVVRTKPVGSMGEASTFSDDVFNLCVNNGVNSF